MKKNHQIIVTLLFLVMLSVVLWGTARGCYEKEMTGCFEQLRVYTNQVGKEIKQTYDRDRDYLEGVAGLLEQYDLTERGTRCLGRQRDDFPTGTAASGRCFAYGKR